MNEAEIKEPEKSGVIGELETFLTELKSYRRYLDPNRLLTDTQKRYRDSLREKLVRKSGALKGIIIELTGKEYFVQFMTKYNMWSEAFHILTALTFCIDATNEAIGKLESDIKLGIRDEEGNVIREPSKGTAELPVNLFDRMQFHPRVIEVSGSLFKTENYASAILEAFKAVDNFVKEKIALSLNGQALMSKVFDENTPLIKLNDLLTQSYLDEQEGFKFLFKGATIGIRNPKAHDNVVQTDPYRTLEYLGLASLLMRRIEEGKLVKLLK